MDRAAGAEGLAAGLTIRPIDVGDEVGLGMLMAVAYRGTIDDPGEDDAWFQADARATLQGSYGVLLEDASVVAVDEEGLVGTCVVTNDGPHLLLAFALVAPGWQNRGVGTALIGASANVLRARGYQEWTLAVTEGSPARRLYERLGFQADFSLRSAHSNEPDAQWRVATGHAYHARAPPLGTICELGGHVGHPFECLGCRPGERPLHLDVGADDHRAVAR